jgi:hypothetical protein
MQPLPARTPWQLVDLVHCAAVLALVVSAAAAEDAKPLSRGQRVFYTGHSFHMFVPRHVEQLVKAAGIPGHQLVGQQGIGGSRVIQHWDLADDQNKAKAALKTGQVDVFTMAAHVAIPDEGITNFVKLGLEHNPKMRFLVQASWFPYDVPDPAKRVKDNAQRDQARIADLQAAIDEWRKKLEGQVDDLNRQHGKRIVDIVPAGDAVVKLRALAVEGKFPGVTKQSELFRDPIGHGFAHVQALVSYCNFVAIYKLNPQGLKVSFEGIDEAQQPILQGIAWETVTKYPYAGVGEAK